jgi:hypothetical protein
MDKIRPSNPVFVRLSPILGKSDGVITVREAGLEPARPKTQVPKTCVSANSTTPARVRRESKALTRVVVPWGARSR